LTGTGGLTVGDWVEVLHEFSAGHNSGGGVGVIIEIIGNLSNVRYIVDSHVEKLIPLTRLTTIPMPYRREKAKLRTRATRQDKSKHRDFLKGHFKQLPQDILDVYQMKARERLAYHGCIKEAIVDTLNDNNEQAFRQLDKVMKFVIVSLHTYILPMIFQSNLLYSMSMVGALTRPLNVGLKATNHRRLTVRT
jgi:hypothetical protein